MRILYLVPYAPTPIRARSYNLIRCLARLGHAITLATLWETERERRGLAELAGEGIEVLSAHLPRGRSLANLLLALPKGRPLQADYCWQPALARLAQTRLSPAAAPLDVVHVEHLRGAQYGLHLKSQIQKPKTQAPRLTAQNPSPYPLTPIVWDSVDCISLLFEQAARNSRSRFGRWITQFELARTRRHEAYLAGQFNRVLVSSAADKAALEELQTANFKLQISTSRSLTPSPLTPNPYPLAPAPPISVLPNGVDVDYFKPGRNVRSAHTVVLTGKMSYHANVTAALHLVEDVMPFVWSRRPDVRVEVVGQSPPREVRALAERHPAQVSVTGYVPDLRPFLWSAAVAAAPIVYGAGSQFKVLEAMACAAPVVATSQAVSALAARAGHEVLVADGAEALAGQMLRLLADEGLRRQVGQAGREYVTRHHQWAAIAKGLEEVYRELIGEFA